MTPIREILAKYPNLNVAQQALGPHRGQLKRWLDADALVDAEGNVYIKTKGQLKHD